MNRRLRKWMVNDFEDFCKYYCGSNLISELPPQVTEIFRSKDDIRIVISEDKKQICFYGLNKENISDRNYKEIKRMERISKLRKNKYKIKEIRKILNRIKK